MNYRHGYHAGNFADVIKHIALVAILLHLRKKDTAFAVVDTHAGRGFYDLTGAQAGSGSLASGATLTVQAEGVTTLTWFAIDRAGNAEAARTLRISIDHAEPITIEDCERVSRVAGPLIEHAELIDGPYNLEVSSPGAERPLRGQAEHELRRGRTPEDR
jgi:hypothetical protein